MAGCESSSETEVAAVAVIRAEAFLLTGEAFSLTRHTDKPLIPRLSHPIPHSGPRLLQEHECDGHDDATGREKRTGKFVRRLVHNWTRRFRRHIRFFPDSELPDSGPEHREQEAGESGPMAERGGREVERHGVHLWR